MPFHEYHFEQPHSDHLQDNLLTTKQKTHLLDKIDTRLNKTERNLHEIMKRLLMFKYLSPLGYVTLHS